jgi:hypothetical protein
MRRFLSPSTAIALAALVVAVVGVSFAANPPSGTVHVCAKKKGGALRLVKKARQCRRGERAIALGAGRQKVITGPSGERGPQGQPGNNGAQGIPGVNGSDGENGADGSDAASVVFAKAYGLQALTGTKFIDATGTNNNPDNDEGSVVDITPNVTIVARDLVVKLSIAPSVSCPEAPDCSRTLTLRDDGADTSVACTVVGSATTCDSGTNSATIGPGSAISIKATIPTGTPNNGPNVRIGWRATTP